MTDQVDQPCEHNRPLEKCEQCFHTFRRVLYYLRHSPKFSPERLGEIIRGMKDPK
jgi:hypothetical protein